MKINGGKVKVAGCICTKLTRGRRPNAPGWTFENGLWVQRSRHNHNAIADAGVTMIAQSIQFGNALQGKTIRYMGVGTGYTLPTIADTDLEVPVLRKSISAPSGSWDNTDIATTPLHVMIAILAFGTAEAIGDLMECGLFQELTGVPMFSHGLFGIGNISNITQAATAVVSCVGHGLSDGDKILIENVDGMTEVNGNKYFIKKSGDDAFELYTDAALTTPVNSTGFGAYSEASPGDDTWKRVIPKTSADTLTVTYPLTFTAA